jgi:AAA15 family ATPase/GTPase
MSDNPTIARVTAEGLHEQFGFEINLKPGLNILYGKNGRGKTTLLHLLANIIELDLERFNFIRFSRITLETSKGDVVELVKTDGSGPPNLSINKSSTSFDGSNGSLSDAEVSSLRGALGATPTYLPAFRSILERTRDSSRSRYMPPERREAEFDAVLRREIQCIREYFESAADQREYHYSRQSRDEPYTIAEKTLLCREWFGRFVPVIRYPSINDVESSLSEEWRRAAIETSSREQRMFENFFAKIFRIVSGVESNPSNESNEVLVSSISKMLLEDDSFPGTPDSKDVFSDLLGTVKSIGAKSVDLHGIDNSLLELYRSILEERNSERRKAFQKSQDFESSINRFLDHKTLKIGGVHSRGRARSQVAVTTDGGNSYGLSALSSGERQILTMLYSASRTRYQSGIFLIDEPELSLHIDWQRIILKELQNQSPGRQLIACTHSPEVGADHLFETQEFIPTSTPIKQDITLEDEDI